MHKWVCILTRQFCNLYSGYIFYIQIYSEYIQNILYSDIQLFLELFRCMTNNLNGYLILKNTHNLPVSMLHGFWLFIQQSLLNSLAMRSAPDLRRASNIFVSSAVKCRMYCYHLTLCLFQHLQRQQYFLLFTFFF